MTAALDIITLVLLGGFIFLGAKKGLVKSLLQLSGGILALLAAFLLSQPVGNFLSESFIQPPVRRMVANEIATAANASVQSDVDDTIAQTDVEGILKTAPAPIKKMLSLFGTTADEVLSDAQDSVNKTAEEYKSRLIDAIVKPVADGLGRIIAFIGLFILASVAVFVISIPLGLVSKIPVIGSFNKLGGAMLGGVQGLFLAFVLCTLITFLMPVVSKQGSSFAPDTVEKTVLFRHLYDLNPIKF